MESRRKVEGVIGEGQPLGVPDEHAGIAASDRGEPSFLVEPRDASAAERTPQVNDFVPGATTDHDSATVVGRLQTLAEQLGAMAYHGVYGRVRGNFQTRHLRLAQDNIEVGVIHGYARSEVQRGAPPHRASALQSRRVEGIGSRGHSGLYSLTWNGRAG